MSKKKINRRDFLQMSGFLAAGTLVASCAPQAAAPTAAPAATTAPAATAAPADTAAPAATTAPAATETSAPEPTAPPASEATATSQSSIPEVAREDTMIFTFSQSGAALAVNQNQGYMTSQEGNAIMLEPLYFYNPHDAKNPLVPWIADGPYAYNKDYTEVTVKLKKGVTWSDGTPFTSADVAWTVNFAISQVKAGLPPPAYGGQLSTNFETVEAPDDYTVIFKAKGGQPNPRMHRWFCSAFDTGLSIMPKHIFEKLDPKTIDKETFIKNTKFTGVTTGPYFPVYQTPEKKIFDFRPDWWGVKTNFWPVPDVKRIIVIPGSGDQSVLSQSFAKNEIDNSYAPLVSVHKSIIEQNPQLTTWTGRKPPYGNVDHWPNLLWMNNEDPLFNDKRVRWAISYAIDTQKLIDNVWGGLGIPSKFPFSQFGIFQRYIDALAPLLEKYPVGVPDLNKSAALMKEAGWTKNADGIWQKGDLVFKPNYGGFNAIYADIGPALCEQLTQAGFKTEYKEPPDLWSGPMSTGKINMEVFGVACDLDVYDGVEFFGKKHYAPTGKKLPLDGWNSRFNNTEYNAIVDKMYNMNPDDDPAAYTDQLLLAMNIWYRELPAIPLWQWMHYVPMNTKYWTNWPSQENPYAVPAQWLRNGGFPVPLHLKKA
jgi:peptide/nickel transport system substrate-binding protein